VESPPITIAVPKGRVLKPLAALLARAGVPAEVLLADDRALIRTVTCADSEPRGLTCGLRFLLLKPDDVPTYVEYGACDLGVCGRDVLVERGSELYQPIDLGIGKCRMVVAGPVGHAAPRDLPRVATKYPRTAATHFARRGVQAEIVYVQGSVELAPVSGLADLIVDLVETGATLVKNGLAERELVAKVSSVLVANRASYKLRKDEIGPLVERLRAAVEPPPA
jgi:ATP phosphoribosyltransferase